MKRKSSIAALLFVITALVCAHAQTQPATLSSPATVTDFKGEVRIQVPGSSLVAPRKGLLLPPESVIETGKGSAVLTLQDGSQALVRAHTRLTVREPANGNSFLDQWLGKILLKVQKRFGGSPSFRMGTPSAVISVRGTQFEVAVSGQHKTTVSVFEGQVEVRGLLGGAPVLLGPGFGTSVMENEAPERPHELPNGGAHSSGGSTTRYQRDDDWPTGHPRTPSSPDQPTPEDFE